MQFRMSACVAAMMLAVAGSTAIAQNEKVTTPEDLDRVMKKAQPAMQATQKAMGSGAYADARAQLATVRQAVEESQQFWVEKKREDALKMNRDTLAKIEALDKLLAGSIEPATATAALKEVGGACRSCHQKYRATDSDDNYIIKPGSLEEKTQ